MANAELQKEMTVDQLLAKQQEVKPLATMEPVEGKPELVKVTPWLPSAGCLCAAALVLPKALIGAVTLTGKTHHCCGKNLQIVEVNFTKGAQVPVAEVFAQAAAAAARVQGTARRRARADAEPCDGCLYNGQKYAVGSVLCMGNVLKECSGGDGVYAWFEIGDC